MNINKKPRNNREYKQKYNEQFDNWSKLAAYAETFPPDSEGGIIAWERAEAAWQEYLASLEKIEAEEHAANIAAYDDLQATLRDASPAGQWL